MAAGHGLDELDTLSVEETAKLLNINIYTLCRWAREGKVPSFRIGRNVRFRASSLKQWMNEQEQAAARDRLNA